MGHWQIQKGEGINRSGQSEGPDDHRWSYLVPNAAIKQRYVNTGRIGANQIYTLNDLPSCVEYEWTVEQVSSPVCAPRRISCL